MVIEFFHEDADRKVLAYVRWSNQDERVVVVVNFSNQHLAGYHVANFPAAQTWHELMGLEVKVAEDSLAIDLPECEAKVFVSTGKAVVT